MIPYFLFCRRKFKALKQVCQLGRLIAISCGHAVHAPVPGLLVLRSLSDSAPLFSSVSVSCMSCLYVFSCCSPLLCSFSLFFIVLEWLLISLSMCIIYDKACRIIFISIAVLRERYFVAL